MFDEIFLAKPGMMKKGEPKKFFGAKRKSIGKQRLGYVRDFYGKRRNI